MLWSHKEVFCRKQMHRRPETTGSFVQTERSELLFLLSCGMASTVRSLGGRPDRSCQGRKLLQNIFRSGKYFKSIYNSIHALNWILRMADVIQFTAKIGYQQDLWGKAFTMEEMRNSMGKPQGKRPLGRPTHKLKDNIKKKLKETMR
jgi:hypothetical protein